MHKQSNQIKCRREQDERKKQNRKIETMNEVHIGVFESLTLARVSREFGWFSENQCKGSLVHQLIHRARHVEALCAWEKHRQRWFWKQRNVSQGASERGEGLICQTKTLALLSKGILFFRERFFRVGILEFRLKDGGSVTALSLVEGPGGKLPGQAILIGKYLSCQERGCLPGGKRKQTTLNSSEALEDDRP